MRQPAVVFACTHLLGALASNSKPTLPSLAAHQEGGELAPVRADTKLPCSSGLALGQQLGHLLALDRRCRMIFAGANRSSCPVRPTSRIHRPCRARRRWLAHFGQAPTGSWAGEVHRLRLLRPPIGWPIEWAVVPFSTMSALNSRPILLRKPSSGPTFALAQQGLDFVPVELAAGDDLPGAPVAGLAGELLVVLLHHAAALWARRLQGDESRPGRCRTRSAWPAPRPRASSRDLVHEGFAAELCRAPSGRACIPSRRSAPAKVSARCPGPSAA